MRDWITLSTVVIEQQPWEILNVQRSRNTAHQIRDAVKRTYTITHRASMTRSATATKMDQIFKNASRVHHPRATPLLILHSRKTAKYSAL